MTTGDFEFDYDKSDYRGSRFLFFLEERIKVEEGMVVDLSKTNPAKFKELVQSQRRLMDQVYFNSKLKYLIPILIYLIFFTTEEDFCLAVFAIEQDCLKQILEMIQNDDILLSFPVEPEKSFDFADLLAPMISECLDFFSRKENVKVLTPAEFRKKARSQYLPLILNYFCRDFGIFFKSESSQNDKL